MLQYMQMSANFHQLDSNMVYLKQRHPAAFEAIDSRLSEPLVVEQELIRLLLEKTSISESDQAKLKREINHRVILGTGAFWMLRYVKAHPVPGQVITIVEPCLDVCIAALMHWNLAELCDGLNVRFVFPGDMRQFQGLLDWVELWIKDGVSWFVEPSLTRHRQIYMQVRQQWLHWFRRREYQYQLSVNLTGPVTENSIRNIPTIIQRPCLSQCQRILGEDAVCLVAPGPSLERVLPILQEFQTRMRIACVDTALPVLLGSGVMPDIIITADHNEKNARHFVSLATSGARPWIFCDPGVWHGIPEQFAQQTLYFSNSKPLIHWLESWHMRLGAIDSWLSVSYMACQVLSILTGGPIVLAGMDLCFKADQAYAAGARKAEVTIKETDQGWVKVIQSSTGETVVPLISEVNSAGDPVLTDAHMLETRNAIAAFAASTGQSWFSLTQGMAIPGISLITPEAMSELLQPQPKQLPGLPEPKESKIPWMFIEAQCQAFKLALSHSRVIDHGELSECQPVYDCLKMMVIGKWLTQAKLHPVEDQPQFEYQLWWDAIVMFSKWWQAIKK